MNRPSFSAARGVVPLRAARTRVAVCALAVLLLAGCSRGDDDGTLREWHGETMGTTYAVKVVAGSMTAERHRTRGARMAARLEAVTAAMSTYDPDSELSRFNRHLSTEPFSVSRDVIDVFLVARRVSRASDGAFDVTVGPLVDAWGFGPNGVPNDIPDDETLSDLRGHVGFQKIVVDSASSSLVKTDPRVVADLSAIAKGYAVDGVADLLADAGFTSFLVEVGGELRAAGEKSDGVPWRVGVEAPLPDLRSLFATMAVEDESVATSGDYRNFWDAGGHRYSHIIDPRTGRPLAYVGAAVTVIHERAVVADAWATAMTVLGPDAGSALADRLGLEAIFVRRGERGLGTTRSRAARDRPLELMGPSERARAGGVAPGL